MMGNRLDELMERLKSGLADLPAETADRALDYYREYIAEALEAGRSEDEILDRLGSAREIIALVRAEVSLANAENRPGPFHLSGAASGTLRGIARSAAKASLILGAIVPYTTAMGFYICAVSLFLGALVAVALMAYGISGMPAGFLHERIGAAGVAILSAAILTSLGLGLWQAANAITRITLRLLRKSLRRDRAQDPGIERAQRKTAGARGWLLACAVAALAGAGMIVPSGLPLRYFSIWNSMRPAQLSERAWTFSPADVGEIEAVTLNARLVLQAGGAGSKEIRVVYEEPDWMEGSAALRGGKLTFEEKSNGRLPFMDFIARHEGMTAVTIEIPQGYTVRAATLESKGGHISIDLPAGRVSAKTLEGDIRFVAGGSVDISAATRGGRISIDGVPVNGGEYKSGPGGGGSAVLESAQGDIEIERP